METINVLLPNLPWKHCRNISGIYECKEMPSGKFQFQSAQFGERVKAYGIAFEFRICNVYVHIARNQSFWICVSVFPKTLANGPLLAVAQDRVYTAMLLLHFFASFYHNMHKSIPVLTEVGLCNCTAATEVRICSVTTETDIIISSSYLASVKKEHMIIPFLILVPSLYTAKRV